MVLLSLLVELMVLVKLLIELMVLVNFPIELMVLGKICSLEGTFEVVILCMAFSA